MENSQATTNQSLQQKEKKASNKSKILWAVLIAGTLLSSLGAWMSLVSLIQQEGLTGWYYPLVAFISLFVFIQLSAIIIRKKGLYEAVIGIAYLLSLIFIQNLFHLIILFIAFLAVNFAIYRIRTELDARIKLSVWRALVKGNRFIVISLVLIVVSHYYLLNVNVNNYAQTAIDTMQRYLQSSIERVLPFFFGDFPDAKNMTVDEFIKEQSRNIIEKSISNESGHPMPDGQLPDQSQEVEIEELLGSTTEISEDNLEIAISQQLNLEEEISKRFNESISKQGREELSNFIDRDVQGDEQFAAVLAEVVTHRINILLEPFLKESQRSAMFLALSSMFLFVALMSFGLIGAAVLLLVSTFIFMILVAFRAVDVVIVQTNVERIG